LQVREAISNERQAIKRLAHARTAPVCAVERALVVELALAGVTVKEMPYGRGSHAALSMCACSDSWRMD